MIQFLSKLKSLQWSSDYKKLTLKDFQYQIKEFSKKPTSYCTSCNRTSYIDNKCIFHCDKKDWMIKEYIKDPSILKYEFEEYDINQIDTDYDEEYIDLYDAEEEYLSKVEYFWQEFNNLKEEKFYNFIFPLLDSKYISYNKSKAVFTGCSFQDDINIQKKDANCDFMMELLEFDECTFYSQTLLISINAKALIIKNSIIENDIKVNINSSDISYFEINNICNSSLIIEKSNFDKIKIISSKFDRLNFNNVNLKKDSTLLLEDLKINRFFIEKLSQTSKYLQFNNIEVFKNIRFRKIEFMNTYFNDFTMASVEYKIEIDKTSFLGTNFNSVSWGDLTKIETTRDTFRELKYIHDEQKDYINADNFYVEEMKRHKNNLRQEAKQDWSSNLQDRFIFLVSEKLSGFGNDWFLSALWYFLISLLFIFGIKIIDCIDKSTENDLYVIFMSTPIYTFLSWIFTVILVYFIAKNKILYSIALVFIFYMTHSYVYEYNMFNELADFINLKINDKCENFSFAWFVHKLITGFIIYHFIIALRRKTRR